ncbi:hypothetical protein I3F58_08360 [Streptomyces sp. MUM 203J]|uniref:SCO1860 family LAETG-anchored protein n=1 Tax=Streptomyces sp. MUM 203J TaxID=2791990 RepID=UPI001F03D9BD|nr:SCO1860 family LAETG-anchored protein [Streptomyces sp. MUM 203J]MCH0539579.1 hypothetical protein [Streptomyces sp. MUM 203J]
MTSTTFRTSVTSAAVLALLAAAPAAHATGGGGDGSGRASAAVLRAGLDVSLLDKGVQVPVRAALNEVQAPATAGRTALTVEVDGAERGKPVSLLRADVANATAEADERRAEGTAKLAGARVHLPGLPLLSLVEVESVTARAVCAAGARPVAEANLLGRVTVLGKRVTVTPGESSTVRVPGVGEVVLDFSERTATSGTAAATALRLKVAVNPLNLNVADVRGTVTLAEASCATPGPATQSPGAEPAESEGPAAEGPAAGPAATGAPGLKVQSEGAAPAAQQPRETLAETGADSRAPYIAGGAAALLLAGAASLVTARRRTARGPRD